MRTWRLRLPRAQPLDYVARERSRPATRRRRSKRSASSCPGLCRPPAMGHAMLVPTKTTSNIAGTIAAIRLISFSSSLPRPGGLGSFALPLDSSVLASASKLQPECQCGRSVAGPQNRDVGINTPRTTADLGHFLRNDRHTRSELSSTLARPRASPRSIGHCARDRAVTPGPSGRSKSRNAPRRNGGV